MDEQLNSFEPDKKRFWFWTAGILAGLIILAATGWFGRTYYHQYKEKHSVSQARAFLASGDYRNALLSARQTLLLNPTNVAACRVMVALGELSHSPAVLDWLRQIAQAEPTIENKLLLASSGLRYQSPPFALTAQILDELAATATNLASYQVVAASLALSTRQLAQAENHFEIATRLEPTNQLYELNLAVIRLGGTSETKAAWARTVLEKLRTDASLGLPALRALVVDRLGHKDFGAAKDYSALLLANPGAALSDQLQQLGILQQLKSGDFTTRLQSVQHQTNALTVAEVSAWMQANGLVSESIQWLTGLPAALQAQPPVRLALADGYLKSSDWRALRDFVSKGKWDEMEFLRLALISRAWSQLGVPAVATSNWGAAVNETGNRFGAMTMLLGLAKQWNLEPEQEDLLERIVQKFPRDRWAQQALEQSYMAAGNTAALNQLYARLVLLFPDNAEFKNNLAATSLLLNTNLPQACKWAAEVYLQKTNDLFVTSTYAFALHLQGRTKEGLAAMQKLEGRLLEQPSAALYYGLLLKAAGDRDAASRFLKIAGTSHQWLPEEKKLLQEATQGL